MFKEFAMPWVNVFDETGSILSDTLLQEFVHWLVLKTTREYCDRKHAEKAELLQ